MLILANIAQTAEASTMSIFIFPLYGTFFSPNLIIRTTSEPNLVKQVRYNLALPEGSESLEVDGLQHMLRCIKLQQQHDENAVVRQLLEIGLSHVMVLDQHAHYNAQYLRAHTRHSVGRNP